MKIVKIKIDDITPYKNNAKKHPQEQIDKIIKSIQDFGMNDPVCVWGDNNIIVEGHGRYLALKQMGKTEIECIRLDHLTDEERRKYTIVHNKTTLESEFDEEVLAIEFEDIDLSDYEFDFGFEVFEFESDEDTEEEEKVNERERTYKQYNLQFNDLERTAGKYQMPIIQKEIIETPVNPPIGFNYVLSTKETDRAVHMFLDDYQIERLWGNPENYVERLMEFYCVFTPDFSLYSDMPIAMQIWNTYRSRLVGQIMQDYGITVIPTVSWGLPETFEFCFDGIEEGSICVVSTIGVKRDEAATQMWRDGMDEMIKRIKPSAIWCYGGQVEYDYKGIPVTYFENEVTARMKASVES